MNEIVLLFPPFQPRGRFLIHDWLNKHCTDLLTVSVGCGDERRTAVYHSYCKRTENMYEKQFYFLLDFFMRIYLIFISCKLSSVCVIEVFLPGKSDGYYLLCVEFIFLSIVTLQNI